MQLEIGSNVIRNVDGAVCISGIELMRLQCAEDSQLLLTQDVFDRTGAHIACLRRNAWAFHDEAHTRVDTTPEKLTLTDVDSGALLLEVDIVDSDTVRITRASYYDRAGRRIEVADGGWRVGDCAVIARRDIDAAGEDVDVIP